MVKSGTNFTEKFEVCKVKLQATENRSSMITLLSYIKNRSRAVVKRIGKVSENDREPALHPVGNLKAWAHLLFFRQRITVPVFLFYQNISPYYRVTNCTAI